MPVPGSEALPSWAPPYLITSDLRSFEEIDNNAHDVELDDAIEAASRAVDLDCFRQFGRVAAPELRYYSAIWNRFRGLWQVEIDDIATTAGLVVTVQDSTGATTGTITLYDLEPRNAVVKGKVFEMLTVRPGSTVMPTGRQDEIAAIGLWGWPAFPRTVKLATKIQGARFHNRRFSPYGIAGSPDEGSELRLLDRVDPDVHAMLRKYRRVWTAR